MLHKLPFIQDRRVALVRLEGIIIDTANMPVATKILDCFKQVKKQGFNSMVFRINSPGGTVGASQEIYSGIKRLQKDGIKVVASFGDMSASGGVYISAGADKIVANSGTITGSIGVIIRTGVIKGLYEKIGIDHQIVKSGPYKDIISDSRYFTDEERAILQSLIDTTYEQFVRTVANERNIELDTVKTFADGRIFSGIQAKEYGLVDEIGSLADAVDLAASLVGIEGEPKIVDMSPKKSLLSKVTGADVHQMLENLGVAPFYSNIPMWLMH